jgi:hypothetical protein
LLRRLDGAGIISPGCDARIIPALQRLRPPLSGVRFATGSLASCRARLAALPDLTVKPNPALSGDKQRRKSRPRALAAALAFVRVKPDILSEPGVRDLLEGAGERHGASRWRFSGPRPWYRRSSKRCRIFCQINRDRRRRTLAAAYYGIVADVAGMRCTGQQSDGDGGCS